ncbi:hypothetical protein [Paenibacillus wynnii]|uniref:hypothetical protein n=1 Tax=Paenibacillus wynnii TaxID=268407 RepID=UPI0027929A77|nr:hypothetical protein [Paenibacillus wynnii]MDQ0195185.1 hypothetical protein [Paenibacillus wynnii]
MSILIVLLYVGIVWIDPYGLLKQGLKRDFYVTSALCLLSFSIAVALAMDWQIPSPSPWIVQWVGKIF